MKLTQTTGPYIGGEKPKERIQPSSRKEFNFPTISGGIKKSEKYCTNEGAN